MKWRMQTLGSPALAGLLAAILAVSLAMTRPGPAAAEPPADHRGTRTLVLVRHGLYDNADPRDDDTGKGLTEDGRKQARLTGARLSAWPEPIDALFASTMTRARETAVILAEALPALAPRLTRDLRECTPPTDRADVMAGLGPGEADTCRSRLEAAFARYFRPTAGRDSAEVLVCHGNVIRYFVGRVLGLDPRRWLAMTIANCSLTVVQVRPDGTMRLLSFSDAGHLPVALQTYPAPRPAAETMRGK
jgi:serine/threonine-protein phosphatase PGAM5